MIGHEREGVDIDVVRDGGPPNQLEEAPVIGGLVKDRRAIDAALVHVGTDTWLVDASCSRHSRVQC